MRQRQADYKVALPFAFVRSGPEDLRTYIGSQIANLISNPAFVDVHIPDEADRRSGVMSITIPG
jgi:hypothetical protein